MKKNGFTLIELLAVIVILAIIALIATPIILGIINDARQESQERSIELYASAIRNGIAAYQLREMKEVQAGTYTSETLPFDVEYDGDVECSTIELYEDGGVYVAGCAVNDIEVEYTYGIKQIEKGKLSSVCTPAEIQYFADSPLEAGYEYECKVDPNKPAYTFYVLTTPAQGATSVNLIMDSNINISGEAVKEGVTDLGLEAWILEEDYPGNDWNLDGDNSYGPITAMNHLQTATKDWKNVNPQTVNMFTACDGYDSCEDKTMTEYTVNARMPYHSEISEYSEDSEDANNAYLYDNLIAYCSVEEITSCDKATLIEGIHEEGMSHKAGVEGYWFLTSGGTEYCSAWYAGYGGAIGMISPITNAGFNGVRPVITLDI